MATTGVLAAVENAVPLTADSTLHTADTTLLTADQTYTPGIGDTASFTGVVSFGIAGLLSAAEDPDTPAFAGQLELLPAVGSFIVTESADAAAFTGGAFVSVFGTLLALEAADTFNATAVVSSITGTLRAFEASVHAPRADTTRYTADTTLVTADAFSAGDVPAFTANISVDTIAGPLIATEAADVASFTGKANVIAALAAIELARYRSVLRHCCHARYVGGDRSG